MKHRHFSGILLAAVLAFSGCGAGNITENDTIPVIEGYGEPEKIPAEYAECFSLYEYANGDTMITMDDGSMYLITDGSPSGISDEITVIPREPDMIYMAASAVMCFYDALGRIGDIRFSALEEDGWYIDSAREAMHSGDIVYAGKYREPDYELLLSEGCRLSVQSTMSEHVPKVKEKLEELGIPVFVDRSSYESQPLGRCEWIKVYAAIAGCPELGNELFAEQKAHFDELTGITPSGKTAVFFYITASGKIVTRKSGDYIIKMIELAGGKNVFDFPGEDNAASSVTLEPEQFCIHAKDADVIIYNSNISGEIHSIAELTAKNPLLADFRAVKNGNVWCTGRSVYQDIMSTGDILTDMHTIFSETGDKTAYLYKID